MSETNIVPIRALSDEDALAWIVGRGQLETTGAALARDWDWTPAKVRRRLATWANDGLITIARGRNGRTVVIPQSRPAEDHPARGSAVVIAPTAAAVAAALMPSAALTSSAAIPPPGSAMDHVGGPVAIAPTAAARGAATAGLVDMLAYAAAIGLAGTAAYFSIKGMIVLFPGAPIAIVVMGLVMEAAKLVTVAFLARQWKRVGLMFRAVLVVLVGGLAAINAAGVYSQLVAAHLVDRMAASALIETEASTLDTRIEVQLHTVADFDNRIGQIDAAISGLAKRGRGTIALNAMAAQRKVREDLVAERQREAEALVNLKAHANVIAARGRAIATEAAPIMYVAKLTGSSTEEAIRLLILLMVLTCDPLALALTAAASRPKSK
jgi:hypothetical protein